MQNIKEKIDISHLTEIHNNNLNNIQLIINRLSKIGYILISTAFTFSTILSSIIFNINITESIRIIFSVLLIVVVLILFICNLSNLKNERIFIKIYNEKIKINLEHVIKEENPAYFILNLNFKEFKSEIKIFDKSLFKSWLTLLWGTIFSFSIITLLVSIFI